MRATPLALAFAFALAALLFAAPALAHKPHRTLRAGRERKTLLMLDEMTREQARRRQQIATLQANVETPDRTHRTIVLASAGIAGVVVMYALEKRRRAKRPL